MLAWFNALSSSKEANATIPQKITSAFLFGFFSLAIMMVNKVVLTVYKFPSFHFVALMQFIVTCLVYGAQVKMGTLSFPPLSRQTVKDIFPLPLLFFGNTVSGLGGTKLMSLPMFVLFRRFTIPLTLLLEFVMLSRRASCLVVLSVGLMFGGAVVGAFGDPNPNHVGYYLVLLNDVFTASTGILMRRKMDEKERYGTAGIMFYNALFSIPFACILLAYDSKATSQLMEYPNWTNPMFLLLFFLSSVMGFLLNWAMFTCTRLNSPLSTNVVGCLKNVFSSYIGMFISDYVFTIANFAGLNVSVLGTIFYSYAEYKKTTEKKATPGPIPENETPKTVELEVLVKKDHKEEGEDRK